MQIVRTIIWVLLLVALLLFSVVNWEPIVTVRIWENLVIDTKIPAIVIVSFLIGFLPMWLYHRAAKWQLKRRIASLESAARTAAATPVAPREPVEEEDHAGTERRGDEGRGFETGGAHTREAEIDAAETRSDEVFTPARTDAETSGSERTTRPPQA